MKQFSLQQLTLRYALVVLSIIISLAIISFISIKGIHDTDYNEKKRQSLQIKTLNISRTLNFYRDIVNNLSKETEVIDLMQFASDKKAQAWAIKMQRLVPDSIGLALFNNEGKTLGHQKTLRVGDLCYIDLNKHIENKPFMKPPVHRDNPELEHFDLFSNIEYANENIGVLFASFELSILQDLLNQITEKGEYLQLFTGDDKLIAETNQFINDFSQSDNITLTAKLPIKNSNWYIKAYIEQKPLTDVMVYLGLTNAILFILVCFILFGYSNRIIKTFSSDFDTIRKLLTRVKNEKKQHAGDIHSRLKETEHIVQDIQGIADEISEHQDQLLKFSQCDDLTGLLNRRGFFNEAAHYLELAKRSIEVTLIILDIDFFKQVNDNLGHAAGDKVLESLAACLKSSSRAVDMSARLGGDEFVILLVKCNTEQAVSWYEKISADFQFQQQKEMNMPSNSRLCSLSAGFTTLEATDEDIQKSLNRADEALYSAKTSGRANIQGFSDI